MTRLGAGGASVNFYVNGVISGTPNATAGTPTASAWNTAIGQYSTLGSNNFFGTIDDVRIYKRVLGAGEIAHLYNGGP